MSTGTERPVQAARDVPAGLRYSVGTGVFLLSLNSSMIAVALPVIGAEFGTGTGLSWLVSGLYVATSVGAPTAGRLTDLYGPRRVYLGGLLLVVLGSVMGVLAPGLGTLTASRVVIGLGGSAQYPAAVAVIRGHSATTGSTPTKALATLSMVGQSAVAFGPPAGGLLVSGFGWQAIFLVNVPLAVAAWLWVRNTVPADPPASPDRPGLLRTIDLPGLLTFVGAVVAVMVFLLSFDSGPALWLLPVAAVLLAAHVGWELRADSPFVDVRLLVRNRALSFTYARTLVTYTAFYLVFYGFPQWLQDSRGLSPAAAGLVVFPVAALGFVSTGVGARLQTRYGVLVPLLIGNSALAAVGLLLWTAVGTGTPVWALLVVAALLGLPNGFNSIGNQSAMLAAAEADRIGIASGLYRTCQYVAAALAAVLLALLTSRSGADGVVRPLGLAVLACGAVLVLTAAFSRALRRR
ncbi:MFS transporter [Streptomyces arenae]|uniref:MFS transporter n=1 Tax=Streptomyces arenae TaxID=29301 RepID=UPI0026595D7E|nr:MFS transporter [Streptomyces arenae]MCG7206622.1 MFS transporter [Streptomyces arenae]